MNTFMTVQALPPPGVVSGMSTTHLGFTTIGKATAAMVTALTQVRRRLHKQLRMLAPVHGMASEAVLNDRGMIKGVGPLLFSVALVAELVNGIRLDHRFGGLAMRIVAIPTGYLALIDGMMRKLIDVGLDIFMAAVAGLYRRLNARMLDDPWFI